MTSDESAPQQPGGNAPPPIAYNPDEFWLRTLLRWYIGLIILPSSTLREIVARRSFWAGVASLSVGVVLSFAFSALAMITSVIDLGSRLDPQLRTDPPLFQDILIGIAAMAAYCPAALVFLAVWALVAHFGANRLGGWGDYDDLFIGIAYISANGFFIYCVGMLGFVVLALSNEHSDPLGLLIATALVVSLGSLVWCNLVAVRLVGENYNLSSRQSGVVIAACIPATLVLGYLAMAGWVWAFFGAEGMFTALATAVE